MSPMRRIPPIALLLAALLVVIIPAGAQTDNLQLGDSELAGLSWEEIVALADGGEVNWFMWGGSDIINAYVSGYLADELQAEYNITLNRVGITETSDVVNQVLGEAEAGRDTDGSVDMIWINGENFRTMQQGGLLFCGYWDVLPNMALVNQDDPTIVFDFGTPVNGCEVPWNRVQAVLIYNSAFVETVPADMDALIAYVMANPGTFTYPAPPDFTGSVFVRHVFYNEADKLFADAGGYEVLLGEFDEAIYEQVAAATWDTLNALEPFLWREGQTYPNDKATLDQLFANTEVTFNLTYEPAEVGANIENGIFPPSTLTHALQSGTIGNVNFVAIPYNSPNKAAALVLANLLLSVEAQLEKAQPDVWGVENVLDATTLEAEAAAAFAAVPRHPAVVSTAELAEVALPELQAAWITRIEQDWQTNVAQR